MPVNVLVVDDSAVLRSMVIRTLRISGLPLGEVHQAGDGAVGLELLDANWIDLALIDINMPVMSGQEMIERIRANPESAGLPIIVVSTDCTEARRQALDVHGVAYVQKPFTPEQLRDAALNAMGLDHADICGNGTAPGGDFDF